MTEHTKHTTRMIQMRIPTVLDPADAPPGFYAVLKSDVAMAELGNICRACDWRQDCSGERYRCMSYELENGLRREDGCSVVFKRRTTAAAAERGLHG